MVHEGSARAGVPAHAVPARPHSPGTWTKTAKPPKGGDAKPSRLPRISPGRAPRRSGYRSKVRLSMHYIRSTSRYIAAAFTVALAVACSDSPTSAADPGPADGKKTPAPGTPTAPAPTPSSDRAFFNGAYLGDAETTPERVEAALRDF